MSPELRRYYENRFEMFSTQGWKDLIEDVTEMLKANDTVSGIDDMRKLGVRQGEISLMQWILSLQEISEKAYEELQNDANVA